MKRQFPLRVLTTYQAVSIVVKHGFQKIRSLRTQDGQYRYQLKDMTEKEWLIYEEPETVDGILPRFSSEQIEDLIEPGGWILLDSFTASAIKQVYEALSAENQKSFDRKPLINLAKFAFAHCK